MKARKKERERKRELCAKKERIEPLSANTKARRCAARQTREILIDKRPKNKCSRGYSSNGRALA